ncbi:hypothetical protein [Pararhodobacter sp.]|uniref:hypothetical protein n=1 Tax=Pararhodobacter sp. TaxID=2127056 RepID=UPI002B000B8B|nr:hypothetical protein [Pararhodobacter sp.]
MKAIIHIGTQKTGTTTIQSFLMQNRAALIRQGIRYQPLSPRRTAQMELGLAGIVRAGGVLAVPNKQRALGVRGQASQAAFVDRFDDSLREGVKTWPEQTYLASSEQIHAWLHTAERMQAMHQMLAKHFTQVRYVVYYRAQEEFMLSTYSEAIRRGEMSTLDQHIDAYLPHMNYHHRAMLWASVVGRENLTVRLFAKDALRNGDLLDDFCDVTGIDRGPLSTPTRKNPSLSVEEIALARRLAQRLPAYLPTGHPNPVFRLANAILRRKLPKPGTPVTLTQAQALRIREANADANEKLRAEFFPDRETLF